MKLKKGIMQEAFLRVKKDNIIEWYEKYMPSLKTNLRQKIFKRPWNLKFFFSKKNTKADELPILNTGIFVVGLLAWYLLQYVWYVYLKSHCEL